MRRHLPVSIKEGESIQSWKTHAHDLIYEIQSYGVPRKLVYARLARKLKVGEEYAHFTRMATMEQVFRAVEVLEKMRRQCEHQHTLQESIKRKAERRARHLARMEVQAKRSKPKEKRLPSVTLPLSEQKKALQALVREREQNIKSPVPDSDVPRRNPISHLVQSVWQGLTKGTEILDAEGAGEAHAAMP